MPRSDDRGILFSHGRCDIIYSLMSVERLILSLTCGGMSPFEPFGGRLPGLVVRESAKIAFVKAEEDD